MYDVFNARKTGGDPTEGIDHTQTTAATTYNNPGFREGRTNGKPTKNNIKTKLKFKSFHPQVSQ